MAIIAFAAFCLLGAVFHIPLLANIFFGGYGTVTLHRWFARAYAYAMGEQWRTVTSDLIYGSVLFCCVITQDIFGATTLTSSCGGMFVAAAFGLLPFGGTYLYQQFLRVSVGDLFKYRQIWRAYSSWSLLGVITTEATANAQAYIVTLFSGPAQFARVAASALLIRPIMVSINALGEYERPQFARHLADKPRNAANGPLRFFRLALIAVWSATALTSAILIVYAPHLMFPTRYKLSDMVTGTILWLLVAAVRALRVPESTLLQAVGQFRPLAQATLISSGVSIFAVTGCLIVGGPILSIVGILLGEGICASAVWYEARRWQLTEPTSQMTTEPT
jgi:hypothetical protein